MRAKRIAPKTIDFRNLDRHPFPALNDLVEKGAELGVKEFNIGMAHRGRLNVLAHIIGFSYEAMLAEFEGQAAKGMQGRVAEAGSGDVKYHVGARELVRSQVGELEISLAPNPSHLEHVNPVVQGMARAERELMARDQIYLGTYAGWYSVRDEAFYAESELVDGLAPLARVVVHHAATHAVDAEQALVLQAVHRHQGALDVGAPTVVVAPASFERPYPPQNQDLFHQVLHSGHHAVGREVGGGDARAATRFHLRYRPAQTSR